MSHLLDTKHTRGPPTRGPVLTNPDNSLVINPNISTGVNPRLNTPHTRAPSRHGLEQSRQVQAWNLGAGQRGPDMRAAGVANTCCQPGTPTGGCCVKVADQVNRNHDPTVRVVPRYTDVPAARVFRSRDHRSSPETAYQPQAIPSLTHEPGTDIANLLIAHNAQLAEKALLLCHDNNELLERQAHWLRESEKLQRRIKAFERRMRTLKKVEHGMPEIGRIMEEERGTGGELYDEGPFVNDEEIEAGYWSGTA